jgi:hypothetical protein
MVRKLKEYTDEEKLAKLAKEIAKQEAAANLELFRSTFQGGNKAWVVRLERSTGKYCKPMPVIITSIYYDQYTVCYYKTNKPYTYLKCDLFGTYDEAYAAFVARKDVTVCRDTWNVPTNIWSEE